LSEALSRLKEFPWANYLLLYVMLFGSLAKRNVGNDKTGGKPCPLGLGLKALTVLRVLAALLVNSS